MSKMKIVKNLSFLKVSGKMACIFEFSVIFYVFQHRSKLIFDIFSNFTFFDIRVIKNCMFLMFWRLGTMLERFFKAKSFGFHISKPIKIPGNIFFDISKVKMSKNTKNTKNIWPRRGFQMRSLVAAEFIMRVLTAAGYHDAFIGRGGVS